MKLKSLSGKDFLPLLFSPRPRGECLIFFLPEEASSQLLTVISPTSVVVHPFFSNV